MSRKRFDRVLRLVVLVLDSLVIVLAFLLAYRLREGLGALDDPSMLNNLLPEVIPLGTALWIAMIAASGGYDSREYGAGTVPYRRVLNASLLVLAGMAATLFLTRTPLSRAFFILLFVIGIPLLLLERVAVRRVLHLLHQRGYGIYRVLLVGSPAQVTELEGLLGRVRWLGLRPVSTLTLPLDGQEGGAASEAQSSTASPPAAQSSAAPSHKPEESPSSATSTSGRKEAQSSTPPSHKPEKSPQSHKPEETPSPAPQSSAASASDQEGGSASSLDPTDTLFALASREQIDLVLFAAGAVPSSTDFRRYVWQFEGHHTQLAVVPSLVDVAADRIRTRPVAGLPIVYVEEPHTGRALSSGKRVFDVLASAVGLLLSSPLLLVAALAVYLTDHGPVLFRQTRVGRDGKPFTMLKFRSMVLDAEARLKGLQGGNTTNTVMFKLEKDPRVTPVGNILRRYSIDELPQLFNILKGDMSLIGPRPPLPREVARYSEEEMRRLRVRPGLTGLWQVSGRSNLSWEETVRLDLYYIDNWSPLQDLSILARTVHAVLASRGAY